MEQFQTQVFEDHGNRSDLLKEWFELSSRQTNIAEWSQKIEERKTILYPDSEPSPAQKKTKIDLVEEPPMTNNEFLEKTSSSSSSTQPSSSNDENNERDLQMHKEISAFEQRISQVALTTQEKKFFQAFLPSVPCELVRGVVVAGFSFATSLKPFSAPSLKPADWKHEGSLLRSIANVDYAYVLTKFENGIAIFRLAFTRDGIVFEEDLPDLATMQDEGLDDSLLLTSLGLELFQIEEKLRSPKATPWGQQIVDHLKAASLKIEEIPRPTSPLSFVGGDNRSNAPTSFNNPFGMGARGSDQQSFVAPPFSVDPSLQAFLSAQTQSIKDLASSVTPFKAQADAKSAERTRCFLLRVTACRANVFEVLGTLGDANLKGDKFFPRDLCDRFFKNSGSTTGSVLRDLPLFKEGVALQQFVQGRCPHNLASIRWDPSKSYGSDAGTCVSHFLPAKQSEELKGFPFFPSTKQHLTNFFANVGLAFQGLFDKNLLDSVDPIHHPLYKMYAFWHTYWLNGLAVATCSNDYLNLEKMDEFYLIQYLQAFLNELLSCMAKPDDATLAMVVGRMTDLNGYADETIQKQNEREAKKPDTNMIIVQQSANHIWARYFSEGALEETIAKHKKDHHWTPAMSKASCDSIYQDMLLDSAWLAYKKKENDKKTNTAKGGNSSTFGGGGGRGGGGSVSGRSGTSTRGGRGGGRGSFPMGPPTFFPNQFPGFTRGAGGYGSGSSVMSNLTSTFAPPATAQGNTGGLKGPALDCINHLMHIFNPAVSRPCQNNLQNKCRYNHPTLPLLLPDQLHLLQVNHGAYQSLSELDRQGAPNKVKHQAMTFLAEAYQRISGQMTMQSSGSSISPSNKG